MLNDLKMLNYIKQQQQQTFLQTTTTNNNNKIVNNIFFEYYYNTSENLIKIPSPSSSLPSTPLSLQSSKSISTTSSESLNDHQYQNTQQHQQMYVNAYTNEEYVCLDDIDDILKPIHINCSYFNNNNNNNKLSTSTHPGLLKITNLRKRSSSVSTSSPSSCSFSSSTSLSSSSIALLSPKQHSYTVNTPDTSNSSSATMIIRKSPEQQQQQKQKNNSYLQTPPPSVKQNLNYIFSKNDDRRSVPNYENEFIAHQQNKRKINSLSPIMTSSRADLHSICQPKQQQHLNFNISKFQQQQQTPKQLKSILLPNQPQTSQNSTPILNHKKFVSFKLHEHQNDENEETFIVNAFSNETYGMCLSPPVVSKDAKELNTFVEENKLRVDRLRVKRLQVNSQKSSIAFNHQHNNSPLVWLV